MNGTLSYLVFAILFMSNKFKAHYSYRVYHVQHVLETEVRRECEESVIHSERDECDIADIVPDSSP